MAGAKTERKGATGKLEPLLSENTHILVLKSIRECLIMSQ